VVQIDAQQAVCYNRSCQIESHKGYYWGTAPLWMCFKDESKTWSRVVQYPLYWESMDITRNIWKSIGFVDKIWTSSPDWKKFKSHSLSCFN